MVSLQMLKKIKTVNARVCGKLDKKYTAKIENKKISLSQNSFNRWTVLHSSPKEEVSCKVLKKRTTKTYGNCSYLKCSVNKKY